MFSKPNKPADTAASATGGVSAYRNGPRIASLVSDGMTIDGDLSGDVELHIDGLVRGDLKVARLTVGESGKVDGSVTAEALDCRGRIQGAITAKQVRLYATAHVDGDITHDELSIETGAWFQGRALKLKQASPVQPLLVEAVAD